MTTPEIEMIFGTEEEGEALLDTLVEYVRHQRDDGNPLTVEALTEFLTDQYLAVPHIQDQTGWVIVMLENLVAAALLRLA